MLHTVYLLVRIIFLITLSEAMGTAELHYYSKQAESLAFEVGFSFYDIMLISFFIKLLKTCPEVDRREGDGGCFGLQCCTVPLISGQSRGKCAEWSCARCYCPLGERLGIIGAGSGRWLLQLQHQRTLFLSTNKETREK